MTNINNLTASKRAAITLLDFCIVQERGKLHIFYSEASNEEMLHWTWRKSGSRGAIGAIGPPKTYESNFIHHDFVQFGKQHSRCKTIFPSIYLSQQICEVHVVSLTAENP